MATVKGENRTNLDAEPSVKVPPGELAGRLRLLYDKYSVTGALAISDIIEMGAKIPKGARVVNMVINHDDLGATGAAEVGWAASEDGSEAADPNGFFASVDLATAANTVEMLDEAKSPGMGKEFAAEVQVHLNLTAALDGTAGDIEMYLWYVTD